MSTCREQSSNRRSIITARSTLPACAAMCAAILLMFTPSNVSGNDLSPNKRFSGCGTIVVDEFYYCYLFERDIDGKRYAAAEFLQYYPGARLHVTATINDDVSFCTIDGGMVVHSISYCFEPTAADINGDDAVDRDDVLSLFHDLGACEGDCPSDLNGDGMVDALDLLILLDAWNAH